jgi:hypothetical protein
MAEGMNVEVAHKLTEHEKADRAKRRWEEVAEVLEVLVLAIAAIATAWSGYQAARGDGHQSVLYGQSSRDRFEADAASTLPGPPRAGRGDGGRRRVAGVRPLHGLHSPATVR